MQPAMTPSSSPSIFINPSVIPSVSAAPSEIPSKTSKAPTASIPPTVNPSNEPSDIPSFSPTLSECGITLEQRSTEIFAVLDKVSQPLLLRDLSTAQGKAINWLIGEDELVRCPDHPNIIQRWTLATIYYATEGDDWFQCSNGDGANDDCGFEPPFFGEDRFLSPENECFWAGIVCSIDFRVTEIEFGESVFLQNAFDSNIRTNSPLFACEEQN